MRCTVIGAGVCGLSCAIRLLEAGWVVEVIAEKFSPGTVSDRAAAVWYPFLVAPVDRAEVWGMASYSVFSELSASEPEAGVIMRTGREYLREPVESPGWHSAITHFRLLEPSELPDEYVHGWEFEVPVIEMPRYMAWLQARCESLGGTLTKRRINSLDDAGGDARINCSGLGAQELAGDDDLHPVRGQVLYLDQTPEVGHFDQQPETLAHVIPRSDCTVLGGTAQANDSNESPSEDDTELILAKCTAMWPGLDITRITGVAVGLRPARSTVRLELEPGEQPLIHNYGHGGGGVTLSWGCADEVVALLSAAT
mgnify:FL=1|tara:strand:+ start:625 stop:1557 length:933 start_codon:yes stop_codon:yes gene_type:complete